MDKAWKSADANTLWQGKHLTYPVYRNQQVPKRNKGKKIIVSTREMKQALQNKKITQKNKPQLLLKTINKIQTSQTPSPPIPRSLNTCCGGVALSANQTCNLILRPKVRHDGLSVYGFKAAMRRSVKRKKGWTNILIKINKSSRHKQFMEQIVLNSKKMFALLHHVSFGKIC